MKDIGFEALKGKTVGEVQKMSKDIKKLPAGYKAKVQKPAVKEARELTAQELIDEA